MEKKDGSNEKKKAKTAEEGCEKNTAPEEPVRRREKAGNKEKQENTNKGITTEERSDRGKVVFLCSSSQGDRR